MKAAVIKDGIVVNSIVVESSDFTIEGFEIVQSNDEFSIGWLYNNGLFTNPETEVV